MMTPWGLGGYTISSWKEKHGTLIRNVVGGDGDKVVGQVVCSIIPQKPLP